MPKIIYAGCPGLSLAISSQFTIIVCAVAKNYEKSLKFFIFNVQGH